MARLEIGPTLTTAERIVWFSESGDPRTGGPERGVRCLYTAGGALVNYGVATASTPTSSVVFIMSMVIGLE
jgi:hypothetical protein